MTGPKKPATGRDLDLPFQPQRPSELDLSDGVLAGGMVVLAASIPVPGEGVMPALVFRFTKPDGTGFYPPMVLAVDEDQMTKTAQLVASASAAAIRAATRGGQPS